MKPACPGVRESQLWPQPVSVLTGLGLPSMVYSRALPVKSGQEAFTHPSGQAELGPTNWFITFLCKFMCPTDTGEAWSSEDRLWELVPSLPYVASPGSEALATEPSLQPCPEIT